MHGHPVVAGSGCATEFARALIRERTKAELASAPAKGRVGGNPGQRARDPAARRKARLARQDRYMECLNEMAQDCVAHVSRLRPDMAWEDVVRIVNGPLPREREWTQSRLPRAMNAYVRDGFLPENVLGRAGRRETDDRLPVIASPSAPFRPSATGWRLCAEHIPQPDELTVVTRCCWNGPRGRT
ncbi:hypothetical protein LX76_04159 [Cereibacter changlensis]|uniref:Uncharacterized protein n=1 Tax=Cereibacter changlensis TaxID=402884 RepID=A0A2W7QJP9_9RHOB|nr:hypothetical protein LX76_04159 [Cereibacter changlensis]